MRDLRSLAAGAVLTAIPFTAATAQQNSAKSAPAKTSAPAQAQPKQENHAGEQLLDMLVHMTPEEREKALSKLQPARRAQLEQRIQEFQKLPQAMQARNRERVERLNNLPPGKQNQVRSSLNKFQSLPEDRKMAINQELAHMSAMSDDDRRAYMNGEEFRNRYSPFEQQMMGNLAEILPARD